MTNVRSLSLYAEAYLDAGGQDVDSQAELDAVRTTLADAPEIMSYLQDPSIPTGDKQRAVSIAFPEATHQTWNMVLLLARDGVINKLDRVIARVKELCAEREDRKLAYVTSAVPLTNDDVTRIANALRTRIGKAVLLETTVDPSIYGGITVRIGDWFFDASLQKQIERMKRTLTI